jgi:hypothetical protein
MQRRTFITTALAALATPYLPAADTGFKIPDPVVVWDTETLTAALEQMFQCQMGPANPFFELAGGVATTVPKVKKPHSLFPNLTEEVFIEPADANRRYIYETYACAVEGGDAKQAEARLANHFYDAFSQLPAGQLIWRVKPQFETVDNIRWGVRYATTEQVEDRQYDLANLPEDGQYDIDTGWYRQVLSKTQLHKMRMRLVLPHLYDHENETVAIPGLFKPEGARITRMI